MGYHSFGFRYFFFLHFSVGCSKKKKKRVLSCLLYHFISVSFFSFFFFPFFFRFLLKSFYSELCISLWCACVMCCIVVEPKKKNYQTNEIHSTKRILKYQKK